MGFLDFFKPKGTKSSAPRYELVEYQIDDENYRQGIRLTDSGIVVSISPQVSIKEVDDRLVISFDFVVEANPNRIDFEKEHLRPMIGDIIIGLIERDYHA